MKSAVSSERYLMYNLWQNGFLRKEIKYNCNVKMQYMIKPIQIYIVDDGTRFDKYDDAVIYDNL